MTPRRIGALIAGSATLVLLLAGAGGGCGKGSSQDEKFQRQCQARGGVPHITHRGDSTSRTCAKPPQPTPEPKSRWQ